MDAVPAMIGDHWDADECEHGLLDFKETPDTAGDPGKNARKRFHELPAETAVCFADSEGGAVVVGVGDRASDRGTALRGVPPKYSAEEVGNTSGKPGMQAPPTRPASRSRARSATRAARKRGGRGWTRRVMVETMERMIDIAPDIRLWAEESGDRTAPPLLLIMGANASGLAWPEPFVEALGRHHRVIRYDHRDTGRSTEIFGERPYAITDLAGDAVAVLDALEVDRAHVVGMSMGGMLTQLLLLDHPDRVLTATFIGTTPLGGIPFEAPGFPPGFLALWEEMGAARDREAEIDWRVRHWELLHNDPGDGTGIPFDPEEFRRLEERIIAHSGRHRGPTAHAAAATDGLDRGPELAAVTVPALVIDAPNDPLAGSARAHALAGALGNARPVTIPGMGHALPGAVLPRLAELILGHTSRPEERGR
ncbi:alpha/beta fold hydrolase [Streptomyces calidiresistens]|nr:alpha/beta hydrolase [Streptomyces calidiresistens]